MEMEEDKKREYCSKVYKKIIGKFLSQEEIEMFERMISMGPMMIMPGGTIGRNNMLLNQNHIIESESPICYNKIFLDHVADKYEYSKQNNVPIKSIP